MSKITFTIESMKIEIQTEEKGTEAFRPIQSVKLGNKYSSGSELVDSDEYKAIVYDKSIGNSPRSLTDEECDAIVKDKSKFLKNLFSNVGGGSFKQKKISIKNVIYLVIYEEWEQYTAGTNKRFVKSSVFYATKNNKIKHINIGDAFLK